MSKYSHYHGRPLILGEPVCLKGVKLKTGLATVQAIGRSGKVVIRLISGDIIPVNKRDLRMLSSKMQRLVGPFLLRKVRPICSNCGRKYDEVTLVQKLDPNLCLSCLIN